ncbi:MAG: GAF domain-containing protein [Leptospiraceae bacterium]|nr:GAF domain-containing protein [Leptospiraceae bacterium]
MLEKASRIRNDTEHSPEESIGQAVQGLRARAEQFRRRQEPTSGNGRPKSEPSPVKIKGLLQRAEAMRAAGADDEYPSSRAIQSRTPTDLTDIQEGDVIDVDELETTAASATESTLSEAELDTFAHAFQPETAGVASDRPPEPLEDDLLIDMLPESAPPPVELDATDDFDATPAAEAQTESPRSEDGGSGLLARAAAMRDDSQTAEVAAGPATEAPGTESDAADTQTERDDQDTPPARHWPVPTTEIGELVIEDIDVTADEDEDDVAAADTESSSDFPDSDEGDGEWPEDLPDLEYAGNSPQSDDPAFHPEAETSAPDEDENLFDQWQQEAEQDAEREAGQLMHRDDTRAEDNRELMLFDEESDFGTTPTESHIASQKKIDHYLSLFDITKEISSINDFDELWDSLLYALMGEVGAETICVFSTTERVSTHASFYPVAHSGFDLPEGWVIKPGDVIYDSLREGSGIKYAEEFLRAADSPLSPLERNILETSRARIVVPLKNMNRMYGIAILGPQLEEHDYTVDDMEFLELLGEMAAVGMDRVLARIEYERDTQDLRRRNATHSKMFSFARRVSRLKNLDELYDEVARHLREDFQVGSYSLVLLSPRDQQYRIFAGNHISPASINRFQLSVGSDLIAMISNMIRVYDVADFRENQEITSNYTNDDLALMQHYWVVPLINMNWLVGFLTIHSTTEAWTEFHRELIVSTAEIVSAVFANCIMLGERETLFRDPFSPLEERLRNELQRAGEFRSALALVDIRVKNIRRLVEVNPPEHIADFLSGLNRAIASFLFEADFMARIGQGRFALILPGRGRDEAEIFVRKLKAEFKRLRFLPGSPVDIQFAHSIISFPADTRDADKMLSILE